MKTTPSDLSLKRDLDIAARTTPILPLDFPGCEQTATFMLLSVSPAMVTVNVWLKIVV